ncbi:MAG: molybdopterin converting factor [Caulobacteraceae bacterium]|jgi:molybdopterin synthase sulfur carrier subunit|nr:molybdopterin converting factor [Caulobacteraceae bacterium]
MKMSKVVLLGRLRDIAGWRERALDPPPATLAALRDLLSSEDPVLGEALAGRGVQAAVNKALARGDVALQPGDEIAFLPPMSGG